MAGGNPGTRACACGNNGTLNCPGGGGTCMVIDAGPLPDAGFNMCMNNTPCTAAFTCNAVCNVNGNPGTRPCTCGGNGMLNCPGGNANCMVFDAGPMPDAGLICAVGMNAPVTGRPCVIGTDMTCTQIRAMGNRTCTCTRVVDAGADAAADTWVCM
jgi:hypothetical protein